MVRLDDHFHSRPWSALGKAIAKTAFDDRVCELGILLWSWCAHSIRIRDHTPGRSQGLNSPALTGEHQPEHCESCIKPCGKIPGSLQASRSVDFLVRYFRNWPVHGIIPILKGEISIGWSTITSVMKNEIDIDV